MDEKVIEFFKSVVETDLDKDIIEIISDSSKSFDEQLEILLSKMGDNND